MFDSLLVIYLLSLESFNSVQEFIKKLTNWIIGTGHSILDTGKVETVAVRVIVTKTNLITIGDLRATNKP